MPRTRRHRSGRRDVVRWFTRVVIALPVVAALGVAAWLGFIADSPAERMLERFRVKTGAPLPYVQLKDRVGASTTLAAAATGQPTLVVISDADCVQCEQQLKHIRSVNAEAASRVVGVSVSVPGRYAAMTNKYAPIPLYDDVNGAFRGKLGLNAVPAVLSVGADGRVRVIRLGLQLPSQLRALRASAAGPVQLSSAAGAAR